MLTLTFADETVVRIEGRNLGRPRQQIRLHRADEICEGSKAEGFMKDDGEPHISRVEIVSQEQEESRLENVKALSDSEIEQVRPGAGQN
jgi:hypothetical protein